jgi:hypothetical protein
LQTITQMIEQLRDLRMTDRIPFRGQLRRSLPGAFTCPPQARHRIPTCGGLDQGF